MTPPRFTIIVQPLADPAGRDVHRRLAMLLKFALRACGLRCVHVGEVEADGSTLAGPVGSAGLSGQKKPRKTHTKLID